MRISYLLAAATAVLSANSSPDPQPHNHPSPTSALAAPSSTPTPIAITNLISVFPDKVQREAELLTNFVNAVKAKEPGVQVFEVDVDRNKSQFLTYEIYQDQATVDAHLKTSYLADLLATEKKEHIKRAEDQVYFLDLVTRFIRDPITAK